MGKLIDFYEVMYAKPDLELPLRMQWDNEGNPTVEFDGASNTGLGAG